MLKGIIKTDNDFASLILRLSLGVVMFPHGAQKAVGWYGGNGIEATLNFFTDDLGIPLYLAILVVAAEFLGAIGLIVGCLTRIAALGIGVTMVVAAAMFHAQHGFFMNWFGNQQGEGFEYHIIAAAIAFVLVIKGGGFGSLDKMMSKEN